MIAAAAGGLNRWLMLNMGQRLAARARASGHAGEFIHWAKVAAEVARISPRAQMDLAVVQAIVDDEIRFSLSLGS